MAPAGASPIFFCAFVLLLMAGCSEAPVAPADASDPAAPDSRSQFSEVQGAIEGVVIDESLLPLPNATVRIVATRADPPPPKEILTDGAGAFAFSLLDPDTYELTVALDSFAPHKQFVQVNAGEATTVSARLGTVPGVEPYVEIYQRVGLVECELAYVATGGPCPRPNGTFAFNPMYYTIPDGFQAIIAETVWTGYSDSMRVDLDINDELAFGSTQWPMALYTGVSPLRYVLTPGFLFTPPPSGQTAGLSPPRPVPTEGFELGQMVGWLGSFQRDINSTAAPVCSNHPLGYCLGVGVAVDLRYTNYMSVFVHAAPPNLGAFTAVPDS